MLGEQIGRSLKNQSLGPWEAISALFDETVVNITNRHRSMGCLLVNSLCESTNYNKDIKRMVRASLAAIRKPLLARLREAQKLGKLKKGVTAEFAADALMNTLHGIRVNARDGKNAKQLRELATFTIASLKK